MEKGQSYMFQDWNVIFFKQIMTSFGIEVVKFPEINLPSI